MPSLLKMMAEIGLNISPFQRGLRNATQAGEGFADSLAGKFRNLVAGYFGFRAIEAATLGVARGMAKIQDQADQFNITTNDVQKLGAAAEDVGLSFEDLGAALLKLSQARKALAAGDPDAIAAVNRRGIGEFAASKASDIEVLKQLGVALGKTGIDDNAMRDLRELLGRSGPRLAAALQNLNKDFGPFVKQEDIARVDEAEASLKRLGREMRNEVAPAMGTASEALTLFLEKWREVRNSTDKSWSPLENIRRGFVLAKDAIAGKPKEELANIFADALKNGVGGVANMALGKGGKQKPDKMFDDIVSPERIENLRTLTEKLRVAQESVALGRLNSGGKIADLQRRIKEYSDDIATVEKLIIPQSLEENIIKQQRIAELKLEQVELTRELEALERKNGIGFEGFRRAVQASGTRPETYGGGAASPQPPPTLEKTLTEYVQVLKNIEKNTGRNIMFLGGR